MGESTMDVVIPAVTLIVMIGAVFFFLGRDNKSGKTLGELAAEGEAEGSAAEIPSDLGIDYGAVLSSDIDKEILWPTSTPASRNDAWKVWFDQPTNPAQIVAKGQVATEFEDSMKVLGTFNTMADFWEKFSDLMQEELPMKSNVRVFQHNVRPLWEDTANREGGKWMVVVPKSKSIGVFNEMLAAMVGNKFDAEINGLVFSKKQREDLVSVWTPSGLSTTSLEVMRDAISELLELHLGIKPEITFMSHNRIKGKQEKVRDRTSPAMRGAKPAKPSGKKFTGMKPSRPYSPGSSPHMSPHTSPGASPALNAKTEES